MGRRLYAWKAQGDGTGAALLAAEGLLWVSELQPGTRRLVVLVLGVISLTCIVAEVTLLMAEKQSSAALLSLASVCAGALAGLVMPHEGD